MAKPYLFSPSTTVLVGKKNTHCIDRPRKGTKKEGNMRNHVGKENNSRKHKKGFSFISFRHWPRPISWKTEESDREMEPNEDEEKSEN